MPCRDVLLFLLLLPLLLLLRQHPQPVTDSSMRGQVYPPCWPHIKTAAAAAVAAADALPAVPVSTQLVQSTARNRQVRQLSSSSS
jgi:hypothetical protein